MVALSLEFKLYLNLTPLQQQLMQKIINYSCKSKTVHLHGRQFSDEGCEYVSKQETRHIKWLNMGTNSVTDRGMQLLAQAKWDKLQELYLEDNQFGSKACKYLTQNPVPSLKMMSLRWNSIRVEGVSHLSKGNWNKLEKLVIGYNYVSRESVSLLMGANWPKLMHLSLTKSNVTPDGFRKLIKSCFKDLNAVYYEHVQLNEKEEISRIKSILTKKYPKLKA